MPSTALDGVAAVVTGASRGFGRAVAGALVRHGAAVVGIARSHSQLASVEASLGDRFTPVVGDVADPDLATRVLADTAPAILVLAAGAIPPGRAFQDQTWDEFEVNWRVDVRQAFEWIGASLRMPLARGSQVVVVSSGAALQGSPNSGGYAGAKATVRFLTRYGAEESDRHELGLRFVAVLPQLTPLTELGRSGATAYAQRLKIPVEQFLERLQPPLTPELVGKTVVDVVTSGQADHEELLLSGRGPQPVA